MCQDKVVVVVITHPRSRNGGTAWTVIQVHAVNLIEISLGERWQPISNQSWVTGSPTTNKADCHWWVPKRRLTCSVSNFTIIILWSTGGPPVCHIKVETSRWVPCPRTQQASLPACFPHYPFFMLSAKQGSCEYHFLKSFGMTRLRNEPQVYRLQCGRSNHYTIAPVLSYRVSSNAFRMIKNCFSK